MKSARFALKLKGKYVDFSAPMLSIKIVSKNGYNLIKPVQCAEISFIDSVLLFIINYVITCEQSSFNFINMISYFMNIKNFPSHFKNKGPKFTIQYNLK